MRFLAMRAFIIIVAGSFLSGCNNTELESRFPQGTNWMPRIAATSTEIANLPPSSNVSSHFQQWVKDSPTNTVRLYKATLHGATNQVGFRSEILGKGGLIGGTSTFASFIYRDPTNGSYSLKWMSTGRYNTDFLKLGNRPKTFMLVFLQSKDVRYPTFQIVAVEGIEMHYGVRAGLDGFKE